MTTGDNNKSVALRKVHHVGSSTVITIDPTIVKKIGIDDETFLLQEVIDGGILMKIRKLTTLQGVQ